MQVSQVQIDLGNSLSIVEIVWIVLAVVSGCVPFVMSVQKELGSVVLHLLFNLSQTSQLVVKWVDLLCLHGCWHAAVDLLQSFLTSYSDTITKEGELLDWYEMKIMLLTAFAESAEGCHAQA